MDIQKSESKRLWEIPSSTVDGSFLLEFDFKRCPVFADETRPTVGPTDSGCSKNCYMSRTSTNLRTDKLSLLKPRPFNHGSFLNIHFIYSDLTERHPTKSIPVLFLVSPQYLMSE